MVDLSSSFFVSRLPGRVVEDMNIFLDVFYDLTLRHLLGEWIGKTPSIFALENAGFHTYDTVS